MPCVMAGNSRHLPSSRYGASQGACFEIHTFRLSCSATVTPNPNASPSFRTRDSTQAAVEEAVDVLSPEEEYLLRVFRRYCSPAVHSTVNDHHKAVPGSKRSPSPIPPRASKASSLLAKARRGAGGSGRGSAAVDISNASTLTAMTAGGEQDSTTENDESTAEPAIAPTDAVSRAKMILDKKRKAAAAARVSGIGSAAAASSGAAGVLRKAKISKTAGALLSATSARLDPVKVQLPRSSVLMGNCPTSGKSPIVLRALKTVKSTGIRGRL